MRIEKHQLRNKYFGIRKGLACFDVFIKSWFIQENFLESEFFSNSRVIGIYIPIFNEVQTFNIIKKSFKNSKTVCLPKIVENELVLYEYKPESRLEIGKFNILEPILKDSRKILDLDTVLIPGIVFNRKGYRIGYGKGYYDRLLQKLLKNCNTRGNLNIIGLAYNFQLSDEEFINDKHDVKMTTIITEKSILRI